MKYIFNVSLILTILFINIGCSKKEQALDFFCGSAVKVPMDEIIKNFEKKENIKINVIYSGSGNLLSQMEISKRGDVYLCGSPDYIIIGEKKNLLIKNSSKILNYLVPAIITPKNNPKNIKSLEDFSKENIRIGIGNPETVCLGLYSIELLEKNKLLEKVLPNISVFARGCAATANTIVLGKVDAIIGWSVFKNWNPDKVEIIYIKPENIPRIAYTALAIPIFAQNKQLSEKFINYVLSDKSKKIFEKYGYISDKNKALRYTKNASIGGEYILPEKYFKLIGKK